MVSNPSSSTHRFDDWLGIDRKKFHHESCCYISLAPPPPISIRSILELAMILLDTVRL